jgi:hypothetical protein
MAVNKDNPLHLEPGMEQKFYEKSGEIVLVFTVEDVQQAMKGWNHAKSVYEQISLQTAFDLMRKYNSEIIESFLYDWAESIQCALQDHVTDSDY